tara:strand:- start:4678 stop:4881 length:204 start_codon:yes stop_codon:yes gene_type:complete
MKKNNIYIDLDLNSTNIKLTNHIEYGKPVTIWYKDKKTGEFTAGFQVDSKTMIRLANRERKRALKNL